MKNIRRIALICAAIIIFCTVAVAFVGNDTMAASNYNTGKRHEVATSLSSQAQNYYTGQYTFDNISTLSPDQIKTKLYTLMSTTMTDSVSYNSLTSYWKTTDATEGKSGTMLFYSDAKSESYNREHVWPKSRASFYQKNGGSDLHHLRPADTNVNSTRSNYTMGEVEEGVEGYKTYSYNNKIVLYYSKDIDLVEVNDNIKGDVARILLYVYVRWQQPNLFENVPTNQLPPMDSDDDANNGRKVIESLETLLNWMELDPVDTWEMSRNDKVEDIQGNRNVFIDYPEYAWLLFGQNVPETYQTPSGNGGAIGNTPTPTPTGGTNTPTPTPTASATPSPTPIAGSVGDYALVTNLGELTTGDYIIYGVNGNYDGALNNECSSSKMGATDVSVVNNVIKNPDSSIVWHFESKGNSLFSIYNAAVGSYLTIYKSASGGFALSDTYDGFKATADSRYNNAICLQSSLTSDRYISIYQDDFRSYSTSNYNELYLFKRIETDTTPTATPSPTPSATPSPTPIGTILYGDTNGDQEIDASDAALILRWVVRLSTISSQGMTNSDVDLDGSLTSADAACILRFIVRLTDKLGA